jgi:hypothetical protein
MLYPQKAKSEENSVIVTMNNSVDVAFDIGDNNGILIKEDLREGFSDAIQSKKT